MNNRFLFNVDVDIDDVIDILVDGVFVDVVVTVFSLPVLFVVVV